MRVFRHLRGARRRPAPREARDEDHYHCFGGSPVRFGALDSGRTLEQRGWLKSDWKQSETGREAKFYSLTRSGQKQLRIEKDSWARLTGAVQLIFDEGTVL